ncbi:hypothetical protein [Alkalihalobacillus sp. AL-G]|nr:hypothetical protein [Alkalihalobacillus sp. AL-G]WLD95493.1 hypothetical protein MOJ78_17155 [Alkalihalobacillus sp. AL-G]
MHQSHGIGYAEYERSLEKRLKIEQKRDQDYRKSQQMLHQFTGKVNKS